MRCAVSTPLRLRCTWQIGPRLELELVKVEDGMCTGRVLYHAHTQRTAAESQAQEAAVKQREGLKRQRREQQARKPQCLMWVQEPTSALVATGVQGPLTVCMRHSTTTRRVRLETLRQECEAVQGPEAPAARAAGVQA